MNNCVIVPSFGGFVAQPVAAKIDYRKGTMLPPGKSVLFNRQLVNNDGLLINAFSARNNVQYNEADQAIVRRVAFWRSELSDGKRIEIDRVGILYKNDENKICFEQDRFFNLLLASFGLGPVSFVAEEAVTEVQEEPIPHKQAVQEERITAPVITPVVSTPPDKKVETPVVPISEVPVESAEKVEKKNTNGWRYVAAACILPIAFYSIWIPVKTDILESGVLSINDFNPFHKQTASVYTEAPLSSELTFEKTADKSLDEQVAELPEGIGVYQFAFTEDLYISVNVEEQTSVVQEDLTPKVESAIPEIQPDAMHFIVGCFGNKTNAKNLVSKLNNEGLQACIVDIKNGLHRVSAGSALSMEAIAALRTKAQQLGYQGWVLK